MAQRAEGAGPRGGGFGLGRRGGGGVARGSGLGGSIDQSAHLGDAVSLAKSGAAGEGGRGALEIDALRRDSRRGKQWCRIRACSATWSLAKRARLRSSRSRRRSKRFAAAA